MNLPIENENIWSSYVKLTKNRKFPKIIIPCLLVLIKVEKIENKIFLGDVRFLFHPGYSYIMCIFNSGRDRNGIHN